MITAGSPSMEDLAKVNESSHLLPVMPLLDQEIERMCHQVEERMFSAIRNGSLDKAGAEQAWIEVYGYKTLMKRLRAKVRTGQTAGERIAPHLTIGDRNE